MLFYILYLIYIFPIDSLNFTRQVSIEWNPGCHQTFCQKTNNSFNNFIYVKSTSTEDTLHYIWSTLGIPSFYIFKTKYNTSLQINWQNLLANSTNSINFDEPVLYKFGIWLPELLEFVDNGLDQIITHPTFRQRRDDLYNGKTNKAYSMQNILWQDFRTTLNHTSHSGTLIGYQSSTKTNISLKLMFFESDSRSDIYPHMLYTSNSTEFILTLNRSHFLDQVSLSELSVPKILPLLGLRVVFAEKRNHVDPVAHGRKLYKDLTGPTPSGPMQYFKKRSMDDEYTPGLFEIDEIISKRHRRSSGYLQWKPIFFDKPDPSYFRDSRPTLTEPLQSIIINTSSSSTSPLPASFESILRDPVFRGLNFGLDDFYGSRDRGGGPNEPSLITFQHTNVTFGDYSDARMPIPLFTEMARDLYGHYGNGSHLHFGQYISWHCVVGWGEAPLDRISSFIVLLITVGFGLPSALVFFTYAFGTLKLLRIKYAARDLKRAQELEKSKRECTLSTQNLLSS